MNYAYSVVPAASVRWWPVQAAVVLRLGGRAATEQTGAGWDSVAVAAVTKNEKNSLLQVASVTLQIILSWLLHGVLQGRSGWAVTGEVGWWAWLQTLRCWPQWCRSAGWQSAARQQPGAELGPAGSTAAAALGSGSTEEDGQTSREKRRKQKDVNSAFGW